MFGPNTSTTTLGDHLVSHHKEAVDKRKLLVKEAKVSKEGNQTWEVDFDNGDTSEMVVWRSDGKNAHWGRF